MSHQPLESCRSRKILAESFSSLDSSEDKVPISRIPKSYHIRVASHSGALVREGCEIEGSRIVMTARMGTTCRAFERTTTLGGVCRYRIAHGWVSEHRRDTHREIIMEVLDMTLAASEDDDEETGNASLGKENESSSRRIAEALTLREASSSAIARTLVALRQAAVYLSRATVVTDSSRYSRDRDEPATTTVSPQLAISLSKVARSYVEQPTMCLDESTSPQSLDLFNPGELGESGGKKDPSAGGKEMKRVPSANDKDSLSGKWKKSSPRTTFGDLPTKHARDDDSLSTSRSASSRSMGGGTEDDDDDATREGLKVNAATVCLYHGAVASNVLLPLMDDKQGQLNTYLVRCLVAHGVLDGLLQGFTFSLACLYDAVKAMQAEGGAEAKDAMGRTAPHLSVLGRSALHAIPSLVKILRKFASLRAYERSPITAMIGSLTDELGRVHIHEIIFDVLTKISGKILPIFKQQLVTKTEFPADIQDGFHSLVSDLMEGLQRPLPPPQVTPQGIPTAPTPSASSSWGAPGGPGGDGRRGLRTTPSSATRAPTQIGVANGNAIGGDPLLTGDMFNSIRTRLADMHAQLGGEGGALVTPSTSTPDASGSGGAPASPSRGEPTQRASSFVVDEQVVAELVSMGFAPGHVLEALRTTRCNIVDVLLGHLLSTSYEAGDEAAVEATDEAPGVPRENSTQGESSSVVGAGDGAGDGTNEGFPDHDAPVGDVDTSEVGSGIAHVPAAGFEDEGLDAEGGDEGDDEMHDADAGEFNSESSGETPGGTTNPLAQGSEISSISFDSMSYLLDDEILAAAEGDPELMAALQMSMGVHHPPGEDWPHPQSQAGVSPTIALTNHAPTESENSIPRPPAPQVFFGQADIPETSLPPPPPEIEGGDESPQPFANTTEVPTDASVISGEPHIPAEVSTSGFESIVSLLSQSTAPQSTAASTFVSLPTTMSAARSLAAATTTSSAMSSITAPTAPTAPTGAAIASRADYERQGGSRYHRWRASGATTVSGWPETAPSPSLGFDPFSRERNDEDMAMQNMGRTTRSLAGGPQTTAEDEMEALKEKSNRLKALSEGFAEHTIANVLSICSLNEDSMHWESSDITMLIPKLLNDLLRDHSPQLPTVFDQLVKLVVLGTSSGDLEAEAPPQPPRLNFGIMYMLLCLLHNTTSREEIMPHLSPAVAETTISSISRALSEHTSIMMGEGEAALWIVPALLLLNELITLPVHESHQGVPTAIVGAGESRTISPSVHSETAEPIQQIDIVNDVAHNSQLVNSSIPANSVSELLNFQTIFEDKLNASCLVPEALWIRLFENVMELLQAARRSPRGIGVETCQSILTLLTTLLQRHSLATRFVEESGLELVFGIQRNATALSVFQPQMHTLGASRDNAAVLALLLRRCLETKSEIIHAITLAVRSIFKEQTGAHLPDEQPATLSLDALLNSTSTLMTRHPSDFVTAVTCTFNFVRFGPREANGDNPVVVQLLSKEVQETNLRQALKRAGYTKDVVQREERRTSSALAVAIDMVLASKIAAESVENEPQPIFSCADVLDALADGILSLHRLPQILAKFNVPQVDAGTSMTESATTAASNFPDWLMRRYLRVDVNDDQAVAPTVGSGAALLPPSKAALELRGACRLLLTLCTHKGSCRTIVFDAIMKHLKESARKPIEGGDEAERLRFLRRLASLLSSAVRASSSAGPSAASLPHRPQTPNQSISVEALAYFVSVGVAEALVAAVESVSFHDKSTAGVTVNALLDPIEMFSRPVLVSHLESMHGAGDGNCLGAEEASATNQSDEISAVASGAASFGGAEEIAQDDIQGGSALSDIVLMDAIPNHSTDLGISTNADADEVNDGCICFR